MLSRWMPTLGTEERSNCVIGAAPIQLGKGAESFKREIVAGGWILLVENWE